MLRRPPPLSPGAPIAVVAPASAPRSLGPYRNGLAQLAETYDVRFAWTSGAERGYLAAPDPDRLNALHRAFENPEIRAIVCVRGGYGCLRLLPDIDWALARQNPTLIVGYSDVTALHLAAYSEARIPGLSGPVVTEWAQAEAATLESFRAWSRGERSSVADTFDATLTPLASGTATGPLLGGNLSVLSRLLGTHFAPAFDGAILVLEEVAEPPYRIDRMFAHLQHAGVLDAVAGVILGDFSTGDLDPEKPTLSLDAVFADYLRNRSYPVVTGLPYGHRLPRCSLPLGIPVRLRATADTASLKAQSSLVLHPGEDS